MFAWLSNQSWIVKLLALAVLIAAVLALFNQVSSCNYRKGRVEYEANEKKLKTERDALIGRAEAAEKRVAGLEPKAAAFDALAEQNKKIDQALAKQVEEVSKEAANEEARANVPVDCRIRAARVCALLSANRIPHDCAAITRESCAGQ